MNLFYAFTTDAVVNWNYEVTMNSILWLTLLANLLGKNLCTVIKIKGLRFGGGMFLPAPIELASFWRRLSSSVNDYLGLP